MTASDQSMTPLTRAVEDQHVQRGRGPRAPGMHRGARRPRRAAPRRCRGGRSGRSGSTRSRMPSRQLEEVVAGGRRRRARRCRRTAPEGCRAGRAGTRRPSRRRRRSAVVARRAPRGRSGAGPGAGRPPRRRGQARPAGGVRRCGASAGSRRAACGATSGRCGTRSTQRPSTIVVWLSQPCSGSTRSANRARTHGPSSVAVSGITATAGSSSSATSCSKRHPRAGGDLLRLEPRRGPSQTVS